DSLDASLGQARANTYLGAKCWAAWLGLEMLSTMGDDADEQVEAQSLAPVLETFLAGSAGADGAIPAILEKDSPGYHSRILPVIEALVYPHYWLNCLTDEEEFHDARAILQRALSSPLV